MTNIISRLVHGCHKAQDFKVTSEVFVHLHCSVLLTVVLGYSVQSQRDWQTTPTDIVGSDPICVVLPFKGAWSRAEHPAVPFNDREKFSLNFQDQPVAE